MLNSLDERKTAEKILQEIIQSVCVPCNIDKSVIQPSVSIGMAIYLEDGTDENTLMHHANGDGDGDGEV
ncbi:MAG: hypothetical protein P8Z75_03525 [Gammaproteobacteria bacterium]